MKKLLIAAFLLGCNPSVQPLPVATDQNTGFPAAASQARKTIAAPALLIRNPTVVDGTGAPPSLGQDILVVDGRIAAYGPDLTAPAHAAVLDATGLTVLPGLIDSHAHTQSVPGAMLRGDAPDQVEKQQEMQLRAYLASGVTTLLDTAISRPTLERFRRLAKEGAPMPTVHHLSPFLTPPGGYFGTASMRGEAYADLWTPPEDPETIRRHFREAAELKPVGVKVTVEDGMVLPVWPLFEAGQFEAIRQEAQAAGAPIFVHSMTNHEHKIALALNPYALVHVGLADEDIEPDVIAAIQASKAYVVTTVVAYEMAGWLWDASGMRQAWIEERVPRIQWETANHARLLDRSLDLMTPQNAPRWAPAWLARLAAPFMRSAETGRRELASSMRATRALYEAGVPIVMGADAGNWPAFATFFHGVGSLLEMELLERAGIPRSEILVAATSRPARMLKQEHRIGTIAPGKDADLVIVAQNPIEHGMQAMRDIRWVIKGGLAKTPAAWLHD